MFTSIYQYCKIFGLLNVRSKQREEFCLSSLEQLKMNCIANNFWKALPDLVTSVRSHKLLVIEPIFFTLILLSSILCYSFSCKAKFSTFYSNCKGGCHSSLHDLQITFIEEYKVFLHTIRM